VSELTERREAAREFLAKIVKDGPTPPPKNRVHFKFLPDGRVQVSWNLGRRLTMEQLLILSYHQENFIDADDQDYVFGFEGDAWDYLDYVSNYRELKKDEL